MIDVIQARDRHFSDYGWLKTYWLFSFSDYMAPDNMNWGALRVFNDDIVDAGQGFGTHPHREMEIITIPFRGELTHRDSMDNEGVIRAGDVQRMSAGTGLTHSEYNLGTDEIHLYQVWLLPGTHGLEPSYQQEAFDPKQWKNTLLPIASGQGHAGAVTFNTDAAIYRSELDSDHTVTHETQPDRRVFVYVVSGEMTVNGVKVTQNDQARVTGEEQLSFTTQTRAEFILIDSPNID